MHAREPAGKYAGYASKGILGCSSPNVDNKRKLGQSEQVSGL